MPHSECSLSALNFFSGASCASKRILLRRICIVLVVLVRLRIVVLIVLTLALPLLCFFSLGFRLSCEVGPLALTRPRNLFIELLRLLLGLFFGSVLTLLPVEHRQAATQFKGCCRRADSLISSTSHHRCSPEQAVAEHTATSRHVDLPTHCARRCKTIRRPFCLIVLAHLFQLLRCCNARQAYLLHDFSPLLQASTSHCCFCPLAVIDQGLLSTLSHCLGAVIDGAKMKGSVAQLQQTLESECLEFPQSCTLLHAAGLHALGPHRKGVVCEGRDGLSSIASQLCLRSDLTDEFAGFVLLCTKGPRRGSRHPSR
mmetsp:Transcript_106949/g.345148  ORF Transcript_106949/g.345148 Transcript_106949/m.345148 type:complete len:313 (+) Transcript_106949:838-1776(+)